VSESWSVGALEGVRSGSKKGNCCGCLFIVGLREVDLVFWGEKMGRINSDDCILYIIQCHSPDRNGILFCCGRSEAEAVTKKIQWRAGNSSGEKY
jgi:hypothetical protein